PLGALQCHLGDLGVILHRFIKRGTDDFTIDRAAHIRHFFWSLTNEANHQVHIRIVAGNAVGDRLHQPCLTGLRWRDDETTLSASDWGHEIEQTGAEQVRHGFEMDLRQREDRCELVEIRSAAGRRRIDTVHGLHTEQAEELLVVLRRANLATDAIASAQAEPADLALADVNVIRSWQEALSTKEAEAIFNDLEDAITKDVALLF